MGGISDVNSISELFADKYHKLHTYVSHRADIQCIMTDI